MNNDRYIKSTELCKRCRYSSERCRAGGHFMHCAECPLYMPEERVRCKCMNIRIGDACPYYEEYTKEPIMKIKLDKKAFMPTRAHDVDAGLDLYAKEGQIVPAKESTIFDTGVHLQLPPGSAGLLVSKIGLNVKSGITSTGLIDEGYTGSIKVKLYNHSGYDYRVKRGDKISQLVILPILRPKLVQVDSLDETERGDGGFGSSGR